MANDANISGRVKDKEGNTSTGTGAETSNATGLRRSGRESPLKKSRCPSPSSVRMSEPTPPVMRKSERLEKQSTPSPRRSERGKNQSSSGSSGSNSNKRLDFSGMKKKVDRNSRPYKEIFKQKARKLDVLDNPSRNILTSKKSCDKVQDLRVVSIGKDSEKTSSNSNLSKHPDELSGNDNRQESSYTGQNIRSAGACQSEDEDSVKVTEVGGSPLRTADKTMPGKLDLDSEAEKKIMNSEMVSLELNERSSDSDVRRESSTKDNSLKRKRNEHSVIAVKEENGADVGGKLSGKPVINLQPEECSEDIQQDGDQNTCLTCKLGGKLLCCEGKGCKKSYHISCLDPPLKDIPLEVWYCLACVEKKIKLGEHSVSEGIESIWKVEMSEEDGSQKWHFFVKFKGLSHVHNRWVSESLLHLQAPSLLIKFNRKNQVSTWKDEWTEPHRILQKRLLGSLKQFNEVPGGRAGDIVLWLVKWRGLDYDQATWESENASFMKLPKTQSLIRDYESRLERAKKTIHKNKKQEIKIGKGSVKAMMLSAGGSTEIDNIHLEFINSLLEQWLRGRNAVIIDDPDRMMKVITFIASLTSDGCWPFMIITGSAGSWDEDLFRLAPSIAAVVYQGNKDTRRKIRALEFYAEGEGLMFDVLITSPEVVVEDLDVLQTIKWEAVIVDDCQRSRMYSHFKHLKSLTAEMRLLLANGQLKDGIIEHLLPLLDCHEDVSGNEGLILNSDHRMRDLKEVLSNYIIDSSKTDTSRFIEYWVPVLISNPQLEQYCATLLANSLALCSSSNSKHDPVGAFRDIVISNRKCCDHPYITDSLLAKHLTEDLQPSDFLDVGIKASGKLQLLDAMLLEIRNRGLRVLVLFQSSGGCPKDNIGDILDDFVRQRFGKDSYERLEVLVNPGRKQTALNTFNNEKSRFVFLLETRACSPSIKLSSVDTVIIFSSDWNPANDFRNLQKITLDTQSQQLKIFRLYSSFTVEENALILAKHGKPLDSNLQSMSRATGHNMLMWGVSHLFCKLEEFHGFPTVATCGSTLLGPVSHGDIIRDFLNILTQNVKDYTARISTIFKARQHQGNYNTDFPLPGEQNIQESDADPPHIFWKKLLDGKQPQWKYTSGLSLSNRKRAQHRVEALEKPEGEMEEVVKKRKKVTNNSGQTSTRPAAAENDGSFGAVPHNVCQERNFGSSTDQNASDAKSTSSLPSVAHNKPELLAVNIQFGEKTDMCNSQKSLHAQLKPEIAKLCEILQLPEYVKAMAQSFLEYVMNNQYVIKEPVTILQAFHISLCWTAASMSKYKVDHKESFELAKKHLNFECRKEEADYVYSMLRCLKKVFMYRRTNSNLAYTAASSGPLSSVNRVQADKSSLLKPPILQQEKNKLEDLSVDGQILSQLAQHGFQKSIKDIEKRFAKQMKKLFEKQQEEIVECQTNHDNEKAQLENKKKTEAAVIRCHSRSSMRVDKLKQLDIEYNEKFEELKRRMEIDLENLKETHKAAREMVEKQKEAWLQGVTSWAKRSFIANTGNAPSNSMGNMQGREIPAEGLETASTHDDYDAVITRVRCTGKQTPDCTGHSLEGPITSSMVANRDPSMEVCENANTIISKNIGAPGTSLAEAKAVTTKSRENCSNADDNVQQNQQDEASPVIAAGSGNPDKSTSVNQEREDIPSGNPEIPVGAEVCETREQQDLEALSVVAEIGDVLMFNETNDQDKSDEQVVMDKSLVTESSDSSERVTAPTQQIEDSPPALPESVSQVRGKDTTDKQDGKFQTMEKVGDKQSQPLDKSDGESVPGVTGSSPDQVADNMRSHDEIGRVRDAGSTLPVRRSQDDGIVSPQNLQTDRGLVDGVSSVSNEDNHPQARQEQQIQQQTAPTLSLDRVPSAVEVDSPLQQSESTGTEDRLPSAEQANTASIQTNSDAPIVDHVLHMPSRNTNSSPNAMDFPSAGGLEGNINNAGCSRQMAGEQIQHSNQATRTVPLSSGPNNYSTQFVGPSTQVPTLAISHDPLQNELKRIRKEREQIGKSHDEMKLQLKADCEREIQEIRRKYEIKYQEVESEFLSRKKELDTNQNKVLMNKILAEAFRSKCMDIKGSGAPSLQDVPSSFLQQLLQLSSQPTNGQRNNISGVGPQATHRPNLHQSVRQPSAPVPVTRPGFAVRDVTLRPGPHLPASPSPAQRPPSNMARPPLVINSISPSAGSVPSVPEVRAPAHHLQPFRPPPSPPNLSPAVGVPTPSQTQQQPPAANIPPQSKAVPAASTAVLASDTVPAASTAVLASNANLAVLPEDNSGTLELVSTDGVVCLSDDD